jgi:uncharacterized protein
VIVLDTTVPVYASGDDHPLRQPCRDLISAIQRGSILATTTPEVIQEFTHVRARRRGRGEAAERARELMSMLGPLLLVDEPSLSLGLRLYHEAPTLGSFDAVLAGVAIMSGATALISADRSFATVDGLRHVDPGWAGFAAWLDDVATGGPAPA